MVLPRLIGTLVPALVLGAVVAAPAHAAAAPGGLVVTGQSTTKLALDWDDVPKAPKYRVQYSTSSSMKNAKYTYFAKSQGTLTKLSAGKTYYVRVRVVSADQKKSLTDYTAKPYPKGATSAKPAKGFTQPVPLNLRSVGATSGSLTLDWNDVVDGTNAYRVQAARNAAMTDGVRTVGFTGSGGTITGLDPSTTYHLRVRMVSADQKTNLSGYTTGTLPTGRTAEHLPFAAPQQLAVVGTPSDSAVDLDWADVDGAPGYTVQYATSAMMAQAKSVRVTGSEGRLTGLAPDETYHVRVLVTDGAGKALSPVSDRRTARTAMSASTVSDVRVGSFNIYGVQNGLPSKKRPAYEAWAYRRSAVIDDIVQGNLDIVGVQEANQSNVYNYQEGVDLLPQGDNQFLDLMQGLTGVRGTWDVTSKAYYNCEKHTTTTSCKAKDQAASAGTRIFFRSDRLTKLSHGAVRYSDQASGQTERWLAWAVFRVNATGQELFFATTHLQPNYTSSGKKIDATSLRKKQWDQLVREVEKRQGSRPVVVTGDFNTSRYGKPSDTMLETMRSKGYGDVVGQKYKENVPTWRPRERVRANVSSINNFQRQATCYCDAATKDRAGNGIDWIFATNRLVVKRWEVVADLDSSQRYRGVIPSDHNLVTATLTLS